MEHAVVINEKGMRRVHAAHPWIFKSDILRSCEAQAGDIVTVNGPGKQFLGRAFFNPQSQITLRLISRKKEMIDGNFWKKRIRNSIARRGPLLAERNAARLIFGESDLMPGLILDRYQDVLVFQTLSAGMDRRKEEFLSYFEELLKPVAVVERNDSSVRDLEGLLKQRGVLRGNLPPGLEIQAAGRRFLLDPVEGQKTGFFLDQIENYTATARFAFGRALDVFCYQGGFSLSIASRVNDILAIDSSSAALEKLRSNADLNGLTNIRTQEVNGFDFLKERQTEGKAFDTIILDPPPFVRSRKDRESGIRGYKEINLRAMKLLNPGGVLVTCSCSQNFTPDLFGTMLFEAARDAKREIQILEIRGAPADHPVLLTFPESSYLQCWILRTL